MTLEVEKSGKIAANIRQLIDELHRQVKEQSHDLTTEFKVVIDHTGAHVTQITTGPDFAKKKGIVAYNLRGELISGT
jgi:hypothetical protein